MIKKNIILIDDDPIIHISVEMMLFGTNYTKQSIIDPEEALLYPQYKEQYNKPDLLLVDLMLGSVSGIKVIKLIREDSYFDQTPIMIFTGFPEKISQDVKLLNELNIACVLPKPLTKTQLLSRIRAFIGS
jgi:DNA-binding response OmpR family regulator